MHWIFFDFNTGTPTCYKNNLQRTKPLLCVDTGWLPFPKTNFDCDDENSKAVCLNTKMLDDGAGCGQYIPRGNLLYCQVRVEGNTKQDNNVVAVHGPVAKCQRSLGFDLVPKD